MTFQEEAELLRRKFWADAAIKSGVQMNGSPTAGTAGWVADAMLAEYDKRFHPVPPPPEKSE